MSSIVLILSIITFLLLPWWLGLQLKVLAACKRVDGKGELGAAINYSINYAYGIVALTYIYILILVGGTKLTDILLPNFGQLVVVLSLSVTVIVAKYKPAELKRELCMLSASAFDRAMIVITLLLSLYAVIAHPYVFDSGQLQAVIQYANTYNEFAGMERGMIGYSSLILLPGTLFHQYPLPFIASALKLPLGIILLSGSMLFARQFRTLNYQYSLMLLLIVLAGSTLGLYGVVTLGKDSIIGIAFMWLFFSLWLTNEDRRDENQTDMGFVLLAAAVTGIITIPYVFLFFVLVALQNVTAPRLWSFASRFLIIGAIPLAWVLQGVVKINPYYMVVVLLSAGGLVRAGVVWLRRSGSVLGVNEVGLAFIPLVSLIALVYLFPLSTNHIDPAFNTVWRSLQPPLDNKTSFLPGLLFSRHTEGVMSQYLFVAGWLGVVVWSFISRSAAVISIASMPFLALLFAALHVEFDWHIIRYRLLWDLYKDIPQWLSGLYVGVGMLAVVSLLLKYAKTNVVYWAVSLMVVFLVLSPFDRELKHPLKDYLYPMATFNDVAGHRDKLMAEVLSFNTKHPEVKYVLFERGIWPGPLSFSNSYGYDSYFYDKQQMIIRRKVAAGEIGMVCYSVDKREEIYSNDFQSDFFAKEIGVIAIRKYACDTVIRKTSHDRLSNRLFRRDAE